MVKIEILSFFHILNDLFFLGSFPYPIMILYEVYDCNA